jgi:phage terminase large subunit-like protein
MAKTDGRKRLGAGAAEAAARVVAIEPVALRFETGKAFLAGDFPALEAELGGLIAGGGYEGPGRSPDRADAMSGR